MEPIKKLLVLAALLAGVVLAPAPAQAVADDADPLARVVLPLAPNNPKGDKVRIIIEGPTADWGVKAFAKSVDASFPGLKVRMHGGCAAKPTWVCVRVFVDDYDAAEQRALTGGLFEGYYALTTYPAPTERHIYLNTHYMPTNAAAVAAHEFAHVLGMNHHQQDGVCGAVPDVTTLSAAEDAALRPYYG